MSIFTCHYNRHLFVIIDVHWCTVAISPKVLENKNTLSEIVNTSTRENCKYLLI